MVKTIGNPGSWAFAALADLSGLASRAVTGLGGRGDLREVPVADDLDTDDIRAALRAGAEDFMAMRADVAFVILIYPLIGLALAAAAADTALLPLVFPAAAGFALLGPFAALGLYEMSRRREAGLPTGWSHAFSVLRSDRIGAILMLGGVLAFLFAVWIGTASLIHAATMGPDAPGSPGAFLIEVLTTAAGWTMIVVGCAVGAVFAVVALAISLVSFPMLVDRDVPLPIAVVASLRVVQKNPGFAVRWGLVVAISLAVGSLPAFLGLIVVLPVLGHATWHLYRRAVPPAD